MESKDKHTTMKKKITISIDEGDFNWMKDKHINVSSLMNAILKKYISMEDKETHTSSTELGTID